MANALTRTSRQLVIYHKGINLYSNLRQYSLNACNPTKMDKRFLVLTGRYKSVEEVPEAISAESIQKCRSKIQIIVANIMIFITIFGSYLMIMNEKSRKQSVLNTHTEELYRKINEIQSLNEANDANLEAP